MIAVEIGLVVFVLVASIYGIVTKDWRASFAGLAFAIVWILLRVLARA